MGRAVSNFLSTAGLAFLLAWTAAVAFADAAEPGVGASLHKVTLALYAWLALAGWCWIKGLRVQAAASARRQRELEAGLRGAERALGDKSKLLATASHEIRTQLNGILGIARLLSGSEQPGGRAAHAARIVRSGETLLTVLNDILDHARIEAGKMPYEVRPFDMREVVDDVVGLMAPLAAQKKISLCATLPPDLRANLCGDPTRLRQVLANLVANAVKFTGHGEVRVDVVPVRSDRDDVRLRFSVRDTGIGMDAQGLARVFEPFVQADASTLGRFGGSGLGLSIARQLVEGLGGRLEVESCVGLGTTFFFESSFKVVQACEAAARAPQCASAAPMPMGMHVLVVEDNPVNQLYAEAVLQQLGHQVTIASDGQQALSHWRSQAFDLILMDNHMPVMTGSASVRQIRQEERCTGRARTAVVSMSADAIASNDHRCADDGVDDVLCKPFTPEQLREKVGRWQRAQPAAVDAAGPNLRVVRGLVASA